MNKTLVVVNPCSANGKTLKKWPHIQQELNAAGAVFDYRMTEFSLHAIEITRDALKQGYDTVVAVGGDGTLNEVVNGFFENDQMINPEARLGVISCGTGGDFVRTAGLAKNVKTACQTIAQGRTRKIDLGLASFKDHQGNDVAKYFINVAGFGIDGEIVYRVNHTSKAFGGFLSFLWGTLAAIASFQPHEIRLEIDGAIRFNGKATVIAVGNGKYIGGGMKIVPMAELDTGYFDVVVVDNMSKFELIKNLPRIYSGSHIDDPRVYCMRGKRIKANSPERVLVDIEGEQPGTLDIEISILPGIMKLLV